MYRHPPSGATRYAAAFSSAWAIAGCSRDHAGLAVMDRRDPANHLSDLQVIWAIGLSMLVLAAMVKLPYAVIAGIGALIVFGHNLLSPVRFQPGETGYSLWTILHDRGFLVAEGPLKIKISYPVLPWIGVILLGYAAGPIYGRAFDAARRVRGLFAAGCRLPAAAGVAARFQHLRRNTALGRRQQRTTHADVVAELHQIPALARFPAADAGYRVPVAGVVRAHVRC